MERVTAAILSHNSTRYIGQAIDSALAQTHPPAEVLIVDDSSDDSPRVIGGYVERHPGLIRMLSVPPCRIGRARNVALENATGEYLAFLDADDLWLPTKTQSQVQALRGHHEIVGAFAPYFDFMIDLDDCARRVPKPGDADASVSELLLQQNMPSSTMLIRLSAIGALRFDEEADCEDVIFAAELAMRGRWRRVNEPLVGKRIHDNQASAGHWHQLRNYQARLKWCRQRREQLDGELARQLEASLSARFVEYLEGRYWRREMQDLKPLCRHAMELCPEVFGQSFLARARIYPRWVYRVRDLLRA